MTTYAIARLTPAPMHPEIVRYLELIDATLAPFSGRFIVHGAPPTVLEGAWPEHVVVIAFPDRGSAEGWYASPAYRHILPYRTRNIPGDAILIDGVSPDHKATDILPKALPSP